MIHSIPCKLTVFTTGGSCLSRIFWEHENLSGLSVIWLIQLLLLKTNIQIKHCSTSKGSYWEDVLSRITHAVASKCYGPYNQLKLKSALKCFISAI